MNIEICNNCKLYQFGGVMAWSIEPGDEKTLLIRFNDANIFTGESCIKTATMKCIQKTYFSNINEEYKRFDEIELNDKKCPYYLEHQMYDWNKK